MAVRVVAEKKRKKTTGVVHSAKILCSFLPTRMSLSFVPNWIMMRSPFPSLGVTCFERRPTVPPPSSAGWAEPLFWIVSPTSDKERVKFIYFSLFGRQRAVSNSTTNSVRVIFCLSRNNMKRNGTQELFGGRESGRGTMNGKPKKQEYAKNRERETPQQRQQQLAPGSVRCEEFLSEHAPRGCTY